MPTGYTADLMEKGQTFKEFIMRCARNFGACIMMRDEPFDAPIPEEFKPSDYHPKEFDKAQKELERLLAMNNEEKVQFGIDERAKEVDRYSAWLLKEEEQNRRLKAMRRSVQDWEPPTSDHKGLKEFMLDQIRISMNDTNYIKEQLNIANAKAPVSYYADAVGNAERDILYHKEEHGKEIERTEGRNRWIRQLRESLAKK